MATLTVNKVHEQTADVELRLSELQTQIDRLSLALHQWHQTQELAHPAEERLSQLVERCAETFNRWAVIDQRHADVVAKLEARLNDWSFVESRLEQDSDQRIRQFEQIIEHEWQALRKVHEEPAKLLREQAASLGETCIAAANLALRGFERSEARLASLEHDLEGRMSQLSREIQGAVAELRGAAARSPALAAGVSPFPLESVMRIHDELRRSDESADSDAIHAQGSPDGGSAALAPTTNLQLPEAAARLSDRMESLERAVTSGQQEVRVAAAQTEGMRRVWRAAIVVALLVLVGGGALVFQLQRRAEARLNDAAARVTAAERHAATATELANQQIAATRKDADRELAEARQTALQAQIMSSVLAAPDLVRFNLSGGRAAPRASAQVLWSRSRGYVFSGSRVPAPPTGTTYQVWLLTSIGPVSAGIFTPDSAGRATLATDNPPTVPRPVANVAVTLEPSGGRPMPTGETVLTRAQ